MMAPVDREERRRRSFRDSARATVETVNKIRLRGLTAARDEFLLAATVQDLRRLELG